MPNDIANNRTEHAPRVWPRRAASPSQAGLCQAGRAASHAPVLCGLGKPRG
jgi:hypothetical protein